MLTYTNVLKSVKPNSDHFHNLLKTFEDFVKILTVHTLSPLTQMILEKEIIGNTSYNTGQKVIDST